MQAGASKFSFCFTCKLNVWILAFVWLAGFVSGAVLSHLTGTSIISLMRAATESRVSIVELVICNIFPLLLTACAVYYSIPVAAECIIFFRALSYGYIVLGVLTAFGFGGWLIGILLLFSSGIVNSLILWLMLCTDKMHNQAFGSSVAVSVSSALVVTVVDYLYIAPFLVRILDHF